MPFRALSSGKEMRQTATTADRFVQYYCLKTRRSPHPFRSLDGMGFLVTNRRGRAVVRKGEAAGRKANADPSKGRGAAGKPLTALRKAM